MPQTIICKYHEDTNPSMTVYEDGWGHCWVCGAHVKIGEPDVKQVKRIPTNVEEELSCIRNLPIKRIRGLDLHQEDSRAYYILWPSRNYYKKRNLEGEPRYLAPKAIKPPIFLYPGNDDIIVIEGEINCMSVKSVY